MNPSIAIENAPIASVAGSSATSPRPARASLSAVPIAWGTLAVFALALTTWAAAIALVLFNVLPLWAGALLTTLSGFVSFTPMHDAAHRSVTRNRVVNEIVGRLAGLPLAAPFGAFRYVHLEHHKHTNDPTRDPDHYSGRGATWTLPLRWMTQDLHYYVLYFRARASRPRREFIESAATLSLFVLAATGLWMSGHASEVVWLVIVPGRIAIGLLALAFDYLPHRPHTTLGKQDRYRATHILAYPVLTPLFLCQNYHLVHHLYPGIPFYRYPRVFEERKHEMLARGARIDGPGRP